MHRGQHYATFTLRTLDDSPWESRLALTLGVGSFRFWNATSGPFFFNALQMDEAQMWSLEVHSGRLYHRGKFSSWAGQPDETQLKAGDVVVRIRLPTRPPALSPRTPRAQLVSAGPVARLRRRNHDSVRE